MANDSKCFRTTWANLGETEVISRSGSMEIRWASLLVRGLHKRLRRDKQWIGRNCRTSGKTTIGVAKGVCQMSDRWVVLMIISKMVKGARERRWQHHKLWLSISSLQVSMPYQAAYRWTIFKALIQIVIVKEQIPWEIRLTALRGRTSNNRKRST